MGILQVLRLEFRKSRSLGILYFHPCTNGIRFSNAHVSPPGVLVSWGEGLFIFRELWSTGNYFIGAGEQAHNL